MSMNMTDIVMAMALSGGGNGGGGGGDTAIIVEVGRYTTHSGLKVPVLTKDDVLKAYNGVVSGKSVIISCTSENWHFVVDQADYLNGEFSIVIPYFSHASVTYILDDSDSVEIDVNVYGENQRELEQRIGKVEAEVAEAKEDLSEIAVKSPNMFDKSRITENVKPSVNGVWSEDATHTLFASDYIPVSPLTTYWEVSAYITGTHFICTYDVNKMFIARISVSNSEWTIIESNTRKVRQFTTNNNVYFIKVCTTKTLLDSFMIQSGTDYTSYIPHGFTGLTDKMKNGFATSYTGYTLMHVKDGKCYPPDVTTNESVNKTVGYTFVDMGDGEEFNQIRCQFVFENRTGRNAQLCIYCNPNGCTSIDYITGKGLHLQLYPDYFKLDVLGANYKDANDNPLYYYNELSGGKVYFSNPLACDGETVHTVSIYTNAAGTKVHCIIDGTDYVYNYVDTHGYIPTLRDAVGRYVGFETYGNGRNDDAYPIVTMFRADGYNADGSNKIGVVLDYFKREDGILTSTPTGQPYRLMNNFEYKR